MEGWKQNNRSCRMKGRSLLLLKLCGLRPMAARSPKQTCTLPVVGEGERLTPLPPLAHMHTNQLISRRVERAEQNNNFYNYGALDGPEFTVEDSAV